MNITVKDVDLRELDTAINAIHSRIAHKKALSDVINRAAGSIALKALMNTKKASFEKILEYFTRVSGVTIRMRKRGTKAGTYKTTIHRESNEIAYGAYYKRKPHLFSGSDDGGELKEYVRRFVSASARSVAYLKHGWKECIDVFRPYMKGAYNKDAIADAKHKSAKTKLGEAEPARQGAIAVATFFNRSATKHEETVPMLQSALNSAIRLETQQLKAQFEQMLVKEARAAGFDAKTV